MSEHYKFPNAAEKLFHNPVAYADTYLKRLEQVRDNQKMPTTVEEDNARQKFLEDLFAEEKTVKQLLETAAYERRKAEDLSAEKKALSMALIDQISITRENTIKELGNE